MWELCVCDAGAAEAAEKEAAAEMLHDVAEGLCCLGGGEHIILARVRRPAQHGSRLRAFFNKPLAAATTMTVAEMRRVGSSYVRWRPRAGDEGADLAPAPPRQLERPRTATLPAPSWSSVVVLSAPASTARNSSNAGATLPSPRGGSARRALPSPRLRVEGLVPGSRP